MNTAADVNEPAFRAKLREAVRLVGNQSELGRLSGIPQQTVWWLLRVADRISAEHAVAIDRATEGRVPKHELRPDLFEAPANSESADPAFERAERAS